MRKAHCRLRAIGVFFQTMIEKREGFAKSAQGLKPTRILDALRGAEAPLFHGTPGFRGGPHFHGGPRFHGGPHFHGGRLQRSAFPWLRFVGLQASLALCASAVLRIPAVFEASGALRGSAALL